MWYSGPGFLKNGFFNSLPAIGAMIKFPLSNSFSKSFISGLDNILTSFKLRWSSARIFNSSIFRSFFSGENLIFTYFNPVTKSLKDVIQIITEQQDNLRLQQYQIDRLYQILEEI